MAGHTHEPAGARNRWRLAATVGLVVAFLGVELVVGLVSGSLALISDAGHMAADSVTLVVALVATTLAARPDRTGRRTFGRFRLEVFASLFAVLVMIGVSVWIFVEAVRRDTHTVVPAGPMLIVGILGLVVNLVSMMLLRGGSQESLNIKGAYLEVMADAAGSVGVIAAALLIRFTGRTWWDTVFAVAIAVFVLVRAVLLGREVLEVLGQDAPRGIDPQEMLDALREVRGVQDVHDLHVWSLTSGMNVVSAHMVADPVDAGAVLARSHGILSERFGVEHSTLQIEPCRQGVCERTDW